MPFKKMKYLEFETAYVKYKQCESAEEKASSLPIFLGSYNKELENLGSWLTNRPAVLKQLHNIVNSDNVFDVTTTKDLPQINPGPTGGLGRTLLIKNSQNVYNPSKLYLMPEKVNYAFQNKYWTTYFPAFRSAPEAHCQLHNLLGLFHTMYIDKMNDPVTSIGTAETLAKFSPDQLVLVNLVTKRRMGESFCHELRRGWVKSHKLKRKSDFIYTVYLLDFGFHVQVTQELMYPLPRPFHSIAPLAVECSLYGISPVGARWCKEALRLFSEFLGKYSEAIFEVEILSDNKTLGSPLLINVDVLELKVATDQSGQLQTTRRLEFKANLTQFMINLQMGTQWNLFPCRPKLMSGRTIRSSEVHLHGPMQIPRITVSFRSAMIIVPSLHHPQGYNHLPMVVICREIKKLFRLRFEHMNDVWRMNNYLAVQVPDFGHRLRTPSCLLDITMAFLNIPMKAMK